MLNSLVALMLLLVCCTDTVAQDAYRATYKLAVGPLTVGKMERTFNIQPDGAYRFESRLKTTGLTSLIRKDALIETSAGIFQAGKFYPNIYTHVRKNKKKPRNIHMHFNQENASIETVINGERLSSPLRENLLDRLVYQAAMMHDLSKGETELRYVIADRGKEKTYKSVFGEQTVIKTKLGRYETVEIIRQRENDKRRTIFWCAPDLGYLPVQVSYREKDGTETIALLTAYQRLNGHGLTRAHFPD